ncbi:MAG: hypothetical protein V1664_01130 [Candidatus Uhrbacteria bacterium]
MLDDDSQSPINDKEMATTENRSDFLSKWQQGKTLDDWLPLLLTEASSEEIKKLSQEEQKEIIFNLLGCLESKEYPFKDASQILRVLTSKDAESGQMNLANLLVATLPETFSSYPKATERIAGRLRSRNGKNIVIDPTALLSSLGIFSGLDAPRCFEYELSAALAVRIDDKSAQAKETQSAILKKFESLTKNPNDLAGIGFLAAIFKTLETTVYLFDFQDRPMDFIYDILDAIRKFSQEVNSSLLRRKTKSFLEEIQARLFLDYKPEQKNPWAKDWKSMKPL